MRFTFLALLAMRPAHGYEMKQAIENAFGSLWPPLNAGQIYTTLSRLERDGLVESREVSQEGRPDKRVYKLTSAGRRALQEWINTSEGGPYLKDSFFTKVVLARLSGVGNPAALMKRQHQKYLQTLRDLNDINVHRESGDDPVLDLLREGAILHLQADLKWIDLCEEKITAGGKA